jgi:hypothetical protein
MLITERARLLFADDVDDVVDGDAAQQLATFDQCRRHQVAPAEQQLLHARRYRRDGGGPRVHAG